MKTLYQSLLDYNMALLRAIAACRAVPLTTLNQAEAVKQLTKALLSPASTAIVLADASPPEQAAVQWLVQQGGQIESTLFQRRHGEVRVMGSARLSREKPWLSPLNSTEALWYKGLIYKRFHVTASGSVEYVYLPSDILPTLKLYVAETEKVSASPTPLTPKPKPPAYVITTSERLRENMFSLLVALQNQPCRQPLTEDDYQTLSRALLPPFGDQRAELEFLLHLGQAAQLLTVARKHLLPQREQVKTWLQQSPSTQVLTLQQQWLDDERWNDLWQVPGLNPQMTGWHNDPVASRYQLRELLHLLGADWYAIGPWADWVKQHRPDFQRPDGDYESWYIQDEAGQFLMGFEHWDDVEGELLRYWLTRLLPWLSLVDLGAPKPRASADSFRLTEAGRDFMVNPLQTKTEATSPNIPAEGSVIPPPFRIGTDFQVQIPRTANLYDRFQLARIANLDRRTETQINYFLTPTSLSRGLSTGITIDQILNFLKRVSHQRIPVKVQTALRRWAARWGTVWFEPAVILHLKYEWLLDELRQHPAIGPLLGETVGGTSVLIATKDAATVERLVGELGYLEG